MLSRFTSYVLYQENVFHLDDCRLQHFKENPYFTNEVLIKDYQYTGVPHATASNIDEMTEAQLDFKEDRDIKPQVSRTV